MNPLDENETDFIDLDLVLSFYMDEFRALRKKNQKKICRLFAEVAH